jgi:hypothetical protein
MIVEQALGVPFLMYSAGEIDSILLSREMVSSGLLFLCISIDVQAILEVQALAIIMPMQQWICCVG